MGPFINGLHPNARKMWRITALPLLMVWMTPWLVAGVAEELPSLPALLIAHIGVPVAAVIPRIRYRRWSYDVAPDDLLLEWGVLKKRHLRIPLDQIRAVRTTRGPLERRFGLATLVVVALGGTERIPGLGVERAEQLRLTLLERVGVG